MIIDNKMLLAREANYMTRLFIVKNFPNGIDTNKVTIDGDYECISHWLSSSFKITPQDNFVIDAQGNYISKIDMHGTTSLFDSRGNVSRRYKVIGDKELSWNYEYDDYGNCTKSVDPDGNVKRYSYEYDSNFSMTKMVHPCGCINTWSYDYDSNGNIVGLTNSSGDIFTNEIEYDSKGRLARINNMYFSYLRELL